MDALAQYDVKAIELLRTSKSSRAGAGVLRDILRFLATPMQGRSLSRAVRKIAEIFFNAPENKPVINTLGKLLDEEAEPEKLFGSTESIENFIRAADIKGEGQEILRKVMSKLATWQYAVLLPIDELIITIAADLFIEPVDLALAHKLALVLKKAQMYYPTWGLLEFSDELENIAENRYRLNAFSESEMSFNPDLHKGEVVVSTFHKAKGLEWDRVYLMSVNNYNFPSGDSGDTYFSEKWFIKEQRNLEAETMELARMVIQNNLFEDEGISMAAKEKARLAFSAERLRMLFVGITRAKRELIITWNTGKRRDSTEAVALQALRDFWNKRNET